MLKSKHLVVAKCKHRNNCYNYEIGDCRGCNIWNYLYNEKAVIEWCKKHNEDISMFTLKIHKELEEEGGGEE